jgi:hypothetical protein
MRSFLIILCCLFSFELGATGAGPPAGMGSLLLVFIVGLIVCVLIVGFIFFYFYKKVKNKKNYLLWLAGISLLITIGWSIGVNFVSYTLIDNQPLESSIEVVDYNDGYYIELEDGLYKFTNKYHKYGSSVNEEERLQKGRMIMLEGPKSDGGFMVYSIGKSSDYYWYQRNKKNYMLTIPLRLKKINKYNKEFEGSILKLGPQWQAEGKDLIKALTKNKCCDVLWIQELLKRGANRNNAINEKTLLHRFYNHTDKSYRERYKNEIIPMLLDAGANINLLDHSGVSFLHRVIRKMPAYSKAKLTESDKEFLQMLLDRGANPNLSFYSGVSLLNSTIRNKQYEITILLLNNGADIHQRVQGTESAYELTKARLKNQSSKSMNDSKINLKTVMKIMESTL